MVLYMVKACVRFTHNSCSRLPFIVIFRPGVWVTSEGRLRYFAATLRWHQKRRCVWCSVVRRWQCVSGTLRGLACWVESLLLPLPFVRPAPGLCAIPFSLPPKGSRILPLKFFGCEKLRYHIGQSPLFPYQARVHVSVRFKMANDRCNKNDKRYVQPCTMSFAVLFCRFLF